MRWRHLGLLALGLAACPGTSEPSLGPREVDFAALTDTEQRIATHEVHRYPLDLAAGTYLYLAVDQLGADVGLTVVDPRGEALPTIDSPTGAQGAEPLHLVASATGVWRLEIRLVDPATGGGSYRPRVEARRPATAEDRRNAQAEEHFWDARQRERTGDTTAAIPRYREAIRLWQQTDRIDRRAAALYRLARTHEADGQREAAIESYQRAAALFQQEGDRHYQALSLDGAGHLYRRRGDLRPARESFEQALDLFRQEGSATGIGSMEVNLGLIARHQGRPSAALGHFQRALEIFRALGDGRHQAEALNHLGLLYAARGEGDRALALYRQALDLLDETDAERRALTLTNQGHGYAAADHYTLALIVYRQALALQRQRGDRLGEAVTLTGMGLVHRRTGRRDAARTAYRQALRLFEALDEPYAQAAVLNNLGWLQVDAGEPERALETLERALALARQRHHFQAEAGALFGLARAARQRGQWTVALEHLEAAATRMEDFRAQTLRDDLRIAQLASAQDLYETYVDLLMEQHARDPAGGFDQRAFQISERGRARNLLESLARPPQAAEALAKPAVLQRRTDLQQQINALERQRHQLRDQGAARDAIEDLDREIDALLDRYHDLSAQMRAARPGFAALFDPPPVTVREIQGLLTDESQLLEYHLGPDRSFLWLVGPSSFESFELPGRRDLETAALEAHRRLRRSHLEGGEIPAARTLDVLGQLVLQPVAHRLHARRLLVVSSGALHTVPFGALPLDGAPLLTRFEVAGLPSASVLAVLAGRNASRWVGASSLAILADPVFQRRDERLKGTQPSAPGLALERLPSTAVEARAIAAFQSPAANSRVALGFDAHRELLLSGRLADYRYLHFATHATLDTTRPEFSSIVLSAFHPSGEARAAKVYAYEIHQLGFAAELVVLSACETALGRAVRGEGVVSLGRGFLLAGAGSVLVSLWQVRDSSTAVLMERFYRALLVEGQPPAAALRQAQESMWREGWAPYHWAGFVLQGLPN